MFNLSGSELVFLLLLALIVLGPEKLPDAVRRFGKTYAEVKKMTSGFQSELKSALDEPMREMRETADALRKAASIDITAGVDEASEPEPPKPASKATDPAGPRDTELNIGTSPPRTPVHPPAEEMRGSGGDGDALDPDEAPTG